MRIFVCYNLIAAQEMQDSILSISRDAVESKEKLDLETCQITNGNWMQGKSNFATFGATSKGSWKVGCKLFKKGEDILRIEEINFNLMKLQNVLRCKDKQ